MKLRTEVTPPSFDFQIDHHDKIMMMGSCFIENISSSMQSAGFTLDINPFGIVYNPQSLANGLQDLIACKEYAIHDLFEYQGVFHSFSHHSRFSDISPERSLERINERIIRSSEFLRRASVLVITFGTTFAYSLCSNGRVVSNCHKLPDRLFQRFRLTVPEVVEKWNKCLTELKNINPDLKILFTVSPIRHARDGMHENQLSKAILLLAVDELIRIVPDCYYFPSYEIVMDDLRDYRFYEEDMIHPSSLAIDYIWEKFSTAFFSSDTLKLINEWKDIQQALNHRPFNPDSEEYQVFLDKIQARKEAFCRKNPSFF